MRRIRVASTGTCKVVLLLICLSFAAVLSGCASSPYQYSHPNISSEFAPPLPTGEQIMVGNPNAFLDASDWIWPGSLLGKLIMWNTQIDSHQIDDTTVDVIEQYLQLNQLDDVLVLVNNYRPGVQWKRLFKNREMNGFWRYTLGILSVTQYTIMPGRFFGGDHYNPYTNVVSLYSNHTGVALHEAGHAKDLNSRKYKGLHAFLYALPGAALYYEAVASNDALSYMENRCEFDQERGAYKVLHPAYGTYLGGTFGDLVLSEPYWAIAAAIPGHITGRIAAARLNPDALENALPCTADDAHPDLYMETEPTVQN